MDVLREGSLHIAAQAATGTTPWTAEQQATASRVLRHPEGVALLEQSWATP
nr:hypothetical protein GCM10020063_024370 [Dactylosporangium thailandense]